MKVVACYYDTHIFFWFIFKNRNPETEPLYGFATKLQEAPAEI